MTDEDEQRSDPFFRPGPPREKISEEDQPSEEDLPKILAYLEQAGLELGQDPT